MTPRLGGGGDLGCHVARIRQLLVVEMAAFFRKQLVLDVNGRGAGILEAAHHVHDIERFAIAGVAIDQHRQAAGARHLADEEGDFPDRDDAEIRQAHRSRHRRARQIERGKAGVAGLQRGHSVMRARHLENARSVQEIAEASSGGLVG